MRVLILVAGRVVDATRNAWRNTWRNTWRNAWRNGPRVDDLEGDLVRLVPNFDRVLADEALGADDLEQRAHMWAQPVTGLVPCFERLEPDAGDWRCWFCGGDGEASFRCEAWSGPRCRQLDKDRVIMTVPDSFTITPAT